MEQETYDKRYATRSLLLFALFVVMVMYIETMLIPSLPSISAQFGINAAEVSLVLSMYLVSGVALNPIVGKLGDIYGKKKVLVRVLAIYTVAVAMTGFAPSFPALLLLRTIQGVGLTIFPLAVSLIQEQFPREKVPQALGIVGAMFGAGAAIGLPLGSLVSNNFGWQTTYHTAVPFVALFSILIYLFIRESKNTMPNVKIDYVGASFLAVFLAMLVFGLSEGATLGWTSPIILFLIIGALVGFVLLNRFERKIDHAILDIKLLRIKNVLNANLIVLVIGLGFFLAYQTFAYEFESAVPVGYGESIFMTGLSMVPFAIMMLITAPLVGRWVSRYGTKPFYLIGSGVSIFGFALAALSTNLITLIISTAIVGAGLASLNIPNTNSLILSIDRRTTGLATSMNAVFRFLGSALGAPIAGIFIAAFGSALSFQYSFYFALLAFFLVAVISTFSEEVLGPKTHVKHQQYQIIKEA
ncbi:MAG: MFS transporter [Candidatus Micrarchaeota archaeon]|nr:MFS transporter [Candidatus Micrarchaeota archaeon]